MFKYYLNNQPFTPTNTGDFTFDIQLVRDAGAYHYTTELGGKIVFSGPAYAFILKHSDCQRIELRIEETCKEGTFQILDLYFTNRDCIFHTDLKQVEVSPRGNTLYQCLLDNYDRKFNFLEVPNIVSSTYLFDYSGIEFRLQPVPSQIEFPGWGLASVIQPFLGSQPFFPWNRALFIRDVKTTFCQGGSPQPPTGTGWELIEDNCLAKGLAKWGRRNTILGDDLNLAGDTTECFTPGCTPIHIEDDPNIQLLFPGDKWILIGQSEVPAPGFRITYYWLNYTRFTKVTKELDNGRLLTEVINYGLNKHCPILDLQSQFLNQDINPVTGNSPSSTEGIQMHAISDIKDPDATEPATIEEITLKEILEGYISSKLNCYWYVDENTKRLIIEHYNDLNNEGTFDLTAIEGGKWLRNKNTFEYDNTDIPKAEEFPSLDSSIDFTGVDINFDNPCATGTKAYTTDKFYSEVEFIINEPEEYGNDGIVMITPDSLEPQGARIENGAITGDYLPNAPQAMANLHEKFWKYYRPFPTGELNFVNQSFTKNRAVKKLQTIQIPLCCFRFFNPRAAFIGNNFTNGQLQQATFNPATGFIELTIQYE